MLGNTDESIDVMMMILWLIQLCFFPLFFRPARKIWLLWLLVVMMISLAFLAAGFCDVA